MRGNPREFRPWLGRIVDPVPKRDKPMRHRFGRFVTSMLTMLLISRTPLGGRAKPGSRMTEHSKSDENGDEVLQLYQQALGLLESLDRLGFHQAAAHLAMALDAMRLRQASLPRHD